MQHTEKPPLAFQLLFLGKHLAYLMERRLASQGLNRTQAIVLITLRRRPGLKALDLCGPARVEPANVTRTLQTLERLGLLERRPHPTDGRASLFYLTPAGEGLALGLEKGLEILSNELLRAVEPADLPHLERALESLRQAVSAQLSAFGHQPSHLSDRPTPFFHSPAEDRGEAGTSGATLRSRTAMPSVEPKSEPRSDS